MPSVLTLVLRPLIDTDERRTVGVSCDHTVVELPSGVISVIGSELTEYRCMAQEVTGSGYQLAAPAHRKL